MDKLIGNSFDKDTKYKLYRNVIEIVHPTISKNNISSYRVVFKDNLFPVRVFYPKKISQLDSIIIYIHGDGFITNCFNNYSKICTELAQETKNIVIAIDYEENNQLYPKLLQKLNETVNYLYQELEEQNFTSDKIVLMGDSIGATLCLGISNLNKNKIDRQILFYPAVSGEYFGRTQYESIIRSKDYDNLTIPRLSMYLERMLKNKKDLNNGNIVPLKNKEFTSYPKTLIIIGNTDPLLDENKELYEKLQKADNKGEFLELEFAGHGFLGSMDFETKNIVIEKINDFLKK